MGATISLAPAAAARFDRRPASARSPRRPALSPPKRPAMISMLFSGSDELSGTSIAPKPASTMTEAIASASSGLTPRRMAISGVGVSEIIGRVRLSAPEEEARARRRAAALGEPLRRATSKARDSARPAPLRPATCGSSSGKSRRASAISAPIEKAGEILARVILDELAHQRQAARAEERAEQAGSALRRTAARRATPRQRRPRPFGLAARAKAPASVWSLIAANSSPGHEGLEALDAAPFNDRPFRMRAGQDDQAPAGIRDAQDLHLLAAHHVGLTVFVLVDRPGAR